MTMHVGFALVGMNGTCRIGPAGKVFTSPESSVYYLRLKFIVGGDKHHAIQTSKRDVLGFYIKFFRQAGNGCKLFIVHVDFNDGHRTVSPLRLRGVYSFNEQKTIYDLPTPAYERNDCNLSAASELKGALCRWGYSEVNSSPREPIRHSFDKTVVLLGRSFYALAVLASGIQQILTGKFVRLVPPLRAGIPGEALWPYLVGLGLIVLGVMMLIPLKLRFAATCLGALLLLNFFLQHIPALLTAPSHGYAWTNPLKVFALVGGVLLLVADGGGTSPGRPNAASHYEKLFFLSRVLFGTFLLVGGVQHFVYADFVDTLVPKWIPSPRFWTYIAGAALIAGGVGLFVPVARRCAAFLCSLMIFLWVMLLHIPRAMADRANAGETSAIFEALALSGVALLIAGNFRQSEVTDRQPRSGYNLDTSCGSI